MPPKPKFTKDEIIAAAFRLTRTQGAQAVTAREVGKSLGVTATPIFTYFSGMDELLQCVVQEARRLFQEYLLAADAYQPAFKMRGMQLIRFAQEEPKLFQLLFMSESGRPRGVEELFNGLGETAQLCLDVIMADYGLDEADARQLFRHVWIHTYGIGALCATGMCRFTEDEISDMLEQDFMAIIELVKSGGGERFGALRVRRPEA